MVKVGITTYMLSEDDVKRIIAEYFMRKKLEVVMNDDIELDCGIKYSGPVSDHKEIAYFKKAIVTTRD